MAQLNPAATTIGDLCTAALKESGAIGVGQTPLAEDITDAWARCQWMLQEWERQRWMVYCLQEYVVPSTGQQSYQIGPTAPDIPTGAGTVRPARLEAAALRQPTGSQQAGASPVDYPLEIIQSEEDYLRVTLKSLTSFTGAVFYRPSWPNGVVFPVPIPQANLYSLVLLFMTNLPPSFAAINSAFSLPYEYYNAILYNLALRLRPKYGLGTFPGDMVPALARDGMKVVKQANAQIARLVMPGTLLRPGIYNIFSDRSY